MSEDQIERKVERAFDKLDARLLAGEISQSEYEAEVRKIDAEAQRLYRQNRL
jgi:uncharacterized membrane protein